MNSKGSIREGHMHEYKLAAHYTFIYLQDLIILFEGWENDDGAGLNFANIDPC